MLLANFLSNRRNGRGHRDVRCVMREAAASVVCEALEGRRLLTTYTIPSGQSAAYLTPGFDEGQVDVRLGSPSNSPSFTFTNQDGLDIIDAGTNSNFLFVDRVPAALKPAVVNGSGGIKVQAGSGSNATLRVETKQTNNDDRSFSITSSTTSTTTIDMVDKNLDNGRAQIGTGVTNLIILVNEVTSPTGYWPPSGGNLNPGSAVSVSTLASGIHLTVNTGDGTYDKVTLGTGSGFIAEQAVVITGAGHDIVSVRGTESGISEALVDFGNGSGTHVNQLNVQEFGTVTLAQAPNTSSHRVVVEDVNVGGGGATKLATLLVEDPSDIADLQINNYGEAFVLDGADGTTIPTFGVGAVVGPLHSYASIEGESTIGTFTIEGEVDFFATSAPSTVSEFAILATSVPDSTGIVNVNDGADVTALTSSKIGSLNFFGTGKLTLQARRDPPSISVARVLRLANLFMGSNPATPNGKLDLKDNLMILDYSGSSPLSSIQSMLTSGYNASGTRWAGNGVGTSLGDANHSALGFAEATDLFQNPSTFENQSIDSTTILVKYTFYGDADLNGTVNLADFNRLAGNFGISSRRWTHGDFNYDTTINLTDFNFLAANFGSTGLGGDDGSSIEEYSQEDLEEMWEELTS